MTMWISPKDNPTWINFQMLQPQPLQDHSAGNILPARKQTLMRSLPATRTTSRNREPCNMLSNEKNDWGVALLVGLHEIWLLHHPLPHRWTIMLRWCRDTRIAFLSVLSKTCSLLHTVREPSCGPERRTRLLVFMSYHSCKYTLLHIRYRLEMKRQWEPLDVILVQHFHEHVFVSRRL